MVTEYSKLFKICLFGDKDVGKETLAKSDFLNRLAVNYMTTTGAEFTFREVEFCGKIIKLHSWIISDDKERFQDLWKGFIKGSYGIILMYDITNAKTLNRLSEWYQLAKNYREDIPILLVGNKLDLEMKRDVSIEQLENFKLNYEISESMEISLETGENVEKMFLNIASMIFSKEKIIEKTLVEIIIWIIDRSIKTKKENLEGKRKLKKLRKFWRKKHFEGTESFEEYLDNQKEIVLNLIEYKNEIVNAKELPEMLKVWEKVKNLLN